jgi:hypothetical protein
MLIKSQSGQINSEVTFQQIAESFPSAIVIANQEGEIAYVNHRDLHGSFFGAQLYGAHEFLRACYR